ncbi:pilin [Candidatus Saccharibacteria bacterium]|nr:pilin [Candidatus Saccharibacteria bacterium]MCL1963386.1 pilin [Candidatus Saccharibacteria bacterium]
MMRKFLVGLFVVAGLLFSVVGVFAGSVYALDCTKEPFGEDPATGQKCPCKIQEDLGEGLSPVCEDFRNPNPPDALISIIVNSLFFGIGVICVVMIVYGGFRYTTSHGNSKSIETAKKTIMGAIIGLAVAVLAYVIVSFVISNVGE